MCIKIIGSQELEFNSAQPLEQQIHDAKEIVVDYDPEDSKIDFFVNEIERLCDTGIDCNVEIKVEPNNYLDGVKLRRTLQKIKYKLDVNEAIKKIITLHAETDKKILEIAQMCSMEKINEQ